ncbi:MAG TPA: hypothetical protein VEI97_13465 [bacterium]|nr:hypothetical protein [bacterium]
MSTRQPEHPATRLAPGPLMARGIALGGWLGAALATQAALRFGHSPLFFLRDLLVTALPLAALGAVVAYLAAATPPAPPPAPQIREAKPVTEDDLRRLMGP